MEAVPPDCCMHILAVVNVTKSQAANCEVFNSLYFPLLKIGNVKWVPEKRPNKAQLF